MAKKQAKSQYVILHNTGWVVRTEGETKVSSVHETQAEAIKAAREIARNQNTEVVIHRPDGRIRERESYGREPLPPIKVRQVLDPITPSLSGAKKISEAVKRAMAQLETVN
jgi:hypothetical protein